MSCADDLFDLRDALESIELGALPAWHKPTTQIGADAQRAAQAVYRRIIERTSKAYREAETALRLKLADDDSREHAAIMTARVQALEEELAAAREALGKAWLRGGASLADGIRAKTAMLERMQESHDWGAWQSMTVCRVCGVCRRADGKNKPCRGTTPGVAMRGWTEP